LFIYERQHLFLKHPRQGKPHASGYSAEDEAFRLSVRDWFETEYPRFQAAWTQDHGEPDSNDLAWRRAWEDHVSRAGWAGLGWPEQYGGRNLPLTRQAIFHEEQARIGAPLGVNIIGHGILGPTLIHFASEAQKQRFLPGILANRDIWCQGYSEPGAGSDLAALTTRAERRATTTGSTATRSGPRSRTSPTTASCWRAPMPRPSATRASASCWWT
jgi:alkylation response protein AidB-like acyl-CoA dehydrogenase